MSKQCPFCLRDVEKLSNHHLIPRCRGGELDETVRICNDCHNAIHAFFSNKELEKEYNSMDALLSNEEFSKHIKWLSKQNPNRKFPTTLRKTKKNRHRNG